MKTLVIGGSGFIGSHVVDALVREGHDVRVFDLRRFPYSDDHEVETVVGDVVDPQGLLVAMRGCDRVLHLAAMADVEQVEKDPRRAQAVNAEGTLNVLEAARRSEIERVVYASTIWVYGDRVGQTVGEDSQLPLPAHFYTATKLAGEMYCRSYGTLYGLEHTILRFGIPYGPRARPAAVVPSFVHQALSGSALTIKGDGSQSRRFVYVEDLAGGVVRGLAPVAANRVYNLVGQESVTIRQVAEVVRGYLGSVAIVHTAGRRGDLVAAEISGERARDELGWTPTTSFQEGVGRYIDWLREEQPWPEMRSGTGISE